MFLLVATACSLYANGQKTKYSYIHTGRPKPLDYNIAMREAAQRWKLGMEYIAAGGNDRALLDSINAVNARTEVRLIDRYGTAWREELHTLTEDILKKHNAIRIVIESDQVYKSLDDAEKMVYFEPYGCKKENYRCFVFAHRLVANDRKFLTIATYKNSKNGKLEHTSSEIKSLHFQFPENGIE